MELPMTRIYTQDNQYWEDYHNSALYTLGKLVHWVNDTVTVSDRVMGYSFLREDQEYRKRKEEARMKKIQQENKIVDEFVKDH